MIVNGKPQRTIWPEEDGVSVGIIDQTLLPHRFETVTLRTLADAARAISEMWVRGAPLIGATGAYGLALALREDHSDEGLDNAFKVLNATRPTAVNLGWALARVREHVVPLAPFMRAEAAWALAAEIADEDVRLCSAIGDHGKALIDAAFRAKMERVNILTHCNAGWLATVDWGTALAPIYKAHDAGVPVHVFVDETRPRNQGAFLTAWELGQHGVPHTVISDNSGGHLMQHGLVDLCIVGTDRTTAHGDVANKIGTYLKALAAHDNGVPFYVAAPSPSIDFSLKDGIREIPIEQRSADEVIYITGKDRHGALHRVQLTPDGSPARNDAFDVTPARLVTGLITERGVTAATEAAIAAMFPDKTKTAPA